MRCCVSKFNWKCLSTCLSPPGASWPRRWGRGGRPRPPWPPPCCCRPRTPPPAAGCWCPPLAACLQVDITLVTRAQNSVFLLSVFLGQIKSRPHHENLLCLFFSLCRMYFVRKKTNVTETINWKKAGWPELELLMAKSSSWVTFSILNSCVQLN